MQLGVLYGRSKKIYLLKVQIFLLILILLVFLHEDYIFLFSIFDNIYYLNSYLDYSKILKNDTHLEVLRKALFKEYIISFLHCCFIFIYSYIKVSDLHQNGEMVDTVDLEYLFYFFIGEGSSPSFDI